MGRLPALAPRDVIKAFGGAGYEFRRQTGSHSILFSPTRHQTRSIPVHNPVKRGTLRALIRQSGLTTEEFLELLR